MGERGMPHDRGGEQRRGEAETGRESVSAAHRLGL
jgi:hypothetical protein